MIKSLRIVCLSAMSVLSGCGTLSVSVEVLDPAVVSQRNDEALIASGLPLALAATPETIAAMVNKLRTVHYQAIEKLTQSYLAETKGKQSQAGQVAALASDLINTFDDRVDESYSDLAASLANYSEQLRQTLQGRLTVSKSDPQYREVIAILRAWQQKTTQFNQLVRADIGELVSAIDLDKALLPPGTAARLSKEVGKIVVTQSLQIDKALAQVSLQSSPYAYAVASAEDARWSHGYNKVYTNGSLGSTDVAIKLDPATGNYILKGLSFDPSDVAAVASKVSTQALLVAAQIAGVPVKLATTSPATTPGGALATTSGALADAQAKLEARRAMEDARKTALLAIANTIMNEEADLKNGTDDQRKAAMATIRNAFIKREAILRPATTP